MGFNNSVFMSERESADRNFAMAYFMKENKCYPPRSVLSNFIRIIYVFMKEILFQLITFITGPI